MDNNISQVIEYLEQIAPVCYQESYDNSGLLTGHPNTIFRKGLICLDVTMAVLNEAIETNCNLIISHHPLIFNPLKRITGNSHCEHIIIQAIKNDIVIYAIHTNLDNILSGVNRRFAENLHLTNIRILSPSDNNLYKLVTYIPEEYVNRVRNSLFEAGAGHIGNYSHCSYNMDGIGTFKPNEQANPFVGNKNQIHHEKEVRTEVIFPVHLRQQVIRTLIETHPYEEAAFDVIPLANANPNIGSGMIGELDKAMDEMEFLQFLKNQMQLACIKYNKINDKPIKSVALCGGSGSFLIGEAIRQKADVFISSEFKHNHFIETEGKLLLADIGHYESEIQTKQLLYDLLIKKFSNFAASVREQNPVSYL
ncbi:MAG: Nif3-like dinuclear metal center hexameric protein [Bacteroidales bacterium]|jgi:dinuclear metal center YbgI/SA1388 family protein|nr:Nif3-like dinuclear metal center hexameric protein [Bacteroidales bacterium]